MTGVAVATTSRLSADAAAETAAAGGNAVDCALAASLVAVNTEPGVCALAGGSYVTVWQAGGRPVTIDGNVAVPGRGRPGGAHGTGAVPVTMDYGNGITTLVGPGSVGVPGTLAAMEAAWRRFGSVGWPVVLAPAIRAARQGFPLSMASRYYLDYSGEKIFGRSVDGYRALHANDGSVRDAGSPIVVPHLADSLEAIARDGARVFYRGELARAMASHVQEGGGRLTLDDLACYEALERPSLTSRVRDWRIASNPPPAIGGVILSAMLRAFGDALLDRWDAGRLARLIGVQRTCLDFRRRYLDLADDPAAECERLLAASATDGFIAAYTSASTVHTSAVDADGTGCAITASAGYGSGEMPAGTGLWLNNCLGELELNRRGLSLEPVGRRLPSNMAPTVARNGNATLAVGSPGADRITTALHQFLINALQAGMPLTEAIAHPRLHVDTSGEDVRLAAEAGLELPPTDLPVRTFPGINMYFGGVAAAAFDSQKGFTAAADPRREGGVCIVTG